MKRKCFSLFRILAVVALVVPLFLVGAGHNRASAESPYVILDPGHGGTDSGSPSSELAGKCGIPSDAKEKDINLDVALRVRDLLQARGVRVNLTRDTDIFVDINPRTAYINQEKPDLAVSIHTNSGRIYPNGTWTCGDGVEALYSSIGPNWAGPNPNLEASKQLALRLATKIHDTFGLRLRYDTGLSDTAGSVGVVRDPVVPSALIEMAYVSNLTELGLMRDRPGDFAQAIASAILDQLGIASMQKLDLVFVIDTTSSMWDDIAAAKAAAVERINGIDAKRTDYRIALVDYRDFPVLPYGGLGDYPAKTELAFTTDKGAAVNAINALTLGWGADWRESVYTALRHAILDPSVGGWRDGADKRVILMGDAPPHDPEPIAPYYTRDDVTWAANSVDPAVIYTIATGGDPTTQASFNEIALATNGKMFTASTAAEVSEALEEAINAAIVPDPATDTVPPTIYILPGKAPNYTQGTRLDFIAADEGGSGLASASASFDGQSVNGAVLLDSPGTHTYTVSAYDKAGNEATTTISFNVYEFKWRPPLGTKNPLTRETDDTIPVKFSILDRQGHLVVDTSLLLSLYDDGASQKLGPFVYNFTNPNLYVDQQNKQYIHTLRLESMGLVAGNYHILVSFESPNLIGRNSISFQIR